MGILNEYAPFLVNTAAGAPRNLSVEGEYDAPRSPFIILTRGTEGRQLVPMLRASRILPTHLPCTHSSPVSRILPTRLLPPLSHRGSLSSWPLWSSLPLALAIDCGSGERGKVWKLENGHVGTVGWCGRGKVGNWGNWESGKVGKWGSGRVGEWESGKVREWENGRVGEW